MAIKVICPECDSAFSVDDKYHGKRIACKACGNPVRVASQEKAAPKLKAAASAPPKAKRSTSKKSKPLPWLLVAGPATLLLIGVTIFFAMGKTSGPDALPVAGPANLPAASSGTSQAVQPATASAPNDMQVSIDPNHYRYLEAGRLGIEEPPPRPPLPKVIYSNKWSITEDPSPHLSDLPTSIDWPNNELPKGSDFIQPATPSRFILIPALVPGNEQIQSIDLGDGKLISSAKLKLKPGSQVSDIAFSPGGKRIAIQFATQNEVYWGELPEKQDGQVELTQLTGLPSTAKPLSTLRFATDDRLILTSGLPPNEEISVASWKLPEGKLEYVNKVGTGSPSLISPGGKYLTLNRQQGEKLSIVFVDLSLGQVARTLDLQDETETGKHFITNLQCGFSPDGSQFALTHTYRFQPKQGQIALAQAFHLIDMKSGKAIESFAIDQDLQLTPISPRGLPTVFRAIDSDFWIVNGNYLLDLKTKSLVWTFANENDNFRSVSVIPPFASQFVIQPPFSSADPRFVKIELARSQLEENRRLAGKRRHRNDFFLPEMITADYRSAPRVSLIGAWTATPDALLETPGDRLSYIFADVQRVYLNRMAFSGHTAKFSLHEVADTAGSTDKKAFGEPQIGHGRRMRPPTRSSNKVHFACIINHATPVEPRFYPISPFLEPIAISPNGERILLYTRSPIGFTDEGRVELYRTEGERLEREFGWRPFGSGEDLSEQQVLDAKFIDDNTLVLSNSADDMAVWDISEAPKPLYRVTNTDGFGITHTGKYLIARQKTSSGSSDGSLTLLEGRTGKACGTIRLPYSNAIDISPNGKMLAVCDTLASDKLIYLVDLTTGSPIAGISLAEDCNRLGWIDNDLIVTDKGVVVSASLQRTVWKFTWPVGLYRGEFTPGQIWLKGVAQYGKESWQLGTQISPVDPPIDNIKNVLAGSTLTNAQVARKGDELSVTILAQPGLRSLPNFEQRVSTTIKDFVARSGYSLRELTIPTERPKPASTPLELYVELSESTEGDLRSLTERANPNEPTNYNTAMKLKLSIRKSGKTAWELEHINNLVELGIVKRSSADNFHPKYVSALLDNQIQRLATQILPAVIHNSFDTNGFGTTAITTPSSNVQFHEFPESPNSQSAKEPSKKTEKKKK